MVIFNSGDKTGFVAEKHGLMPDLAIRINAVLHKGRLRY